MGSNPWPSKLCDFIIYVICSSEFWGLLCGQGKGAPSFDPVFTFSRAKDASEGWVDGFFSLSS